MFNKDTIFRSPIPGNKVSLAVTHWLGLKNGAGIAGGQLAEHDPAVCPGSIKGYPGLREHKHSQEINGSH